MKRLIILIACFYLAGCSSLNKLKKTEGKPINSVISEFGEPTKINMNTGDSLYIYEKTITLQSAEISKGQMTLDRMVSPSATKTEKITFKVKKGIVVKVEKEIEYHRK